MIFRITNESVVENIYNKINTGNKFNEIHFADKTNGLLVGEDQEGAFIATTHDGGNTFSPFVTPRNLNNMYSTLSEAYMYNEYIGVAAGHYESNTYPQTSYVVITRDGGTTWDELDFHIPLTVYSLYYLNSNCFYVSGDTANNSGALYRFTSNFIDTTSSIRIEIQDTIYSGCLDTIQLNPEITYDGNSSLTYLWKPSTGLSDPNIRNPEVHLYTQEVSYTLLVSDGVSSQLEKTLVKTKSKEEPQICLVSYDNTTKSNTIYFNKNYIDPVKEYLVYADSSGTDICFGKIDSETSGVFRDTSSSRLDKASFYKMSYIDACNHESSLSAAHSTIHVEKEILDQEVSLSWNSYEDSPVDTYAIYLENTNRVQLLDLTGETTYIINDLTEGAYTIWVEAQIAKTCSHPELNNDEEYYHSRSNYVEVVVNSDLPVFSLSWYEESFHDFLDVSDSTSACIGETILLDTLYSGRSERVLDLVWLSRSDGVLESLTADEILLTSDTLLFIEITDENGCTYLDSISIIMNENCNTGKTSFLQPKIDAKVYPNPNKGSFYLDITLDQNGSYRIEILDNLSRQIYSEEYSNVLEIKENIALELEAGFYVLRIAGREQVISLPLIIQ